MGGFDTYHNLKTTHLEDIVCAGSFRPNGATGVVSGSVQGTGFSVARAGAGLYTLTFDNTLPDDVRAMASVRAADALATVCQVGDYSAADKTLQLRVFQEAAAGARLKRHPISLFDLRRITQSKTVDVASAGDLVLDGTNPPTLDETGLSFGYAFDADNEEAGINFQIPDDWDGESDLTLDVVWHPESGTALADTNTAIWELDYYSRGNGEAVDGGTPVAATATETQSGAGTDKEEYRTSITLDWDNSNQPIARGDSIHGKVSIDFTTMTYAADIVFMRATLTYNTRTPLEAPFIERVNGGTDQALRMVWQAGDVTEVLVPPFMKPADFDDSVALSLNALVAMSGTTDAGGLDVKAWDGIGDTEMGGGAYGPFADTIVQMEKDISGANLAAEPGMVNASLVPDAHSTDEMWIYGLYWEYTSENKDGILAAKDLAADADNEVSFAVFFQNTDV